MKGLMIATVAVVGVLAVGNAAAQEALAKSSGCLNCHAVDTKKMGPAFKDVEVHVAKRDDPCALDFAELTDVRSTPAVDANHGHANDVIGPADLGPGTRRERAGCGAGH